MPDLNGNMTLEEMRAKLDELGIPRDGWSPAGGKRVKSPILEKQKDNLRRLLGLLEEQVEQDKQKVADLHVTLQRLKHGGGV